MYKTAKIPLFRGGVWSTHKVRDLSLQEFFSHISDPENDTKDYYKRIAKATIDGDLVLKTKLKEKNSFACPAVTLSGDGRGYINIEGYNGLLVLDFDKLDDPILIKDALADMPYTIATWLSVSRKGVRALVRIPQVYSVDQYKAHFWGWANEFSDELEGFDIATQNPVLPLFLSYDPDIYWTPNAIEWTQTGRQPEKVNVTMPRVVNLSEQGQNSSVYARWSIANITHAIDSITNDGHPQLRAACFTLGGRVGAGYLDFWEAESLVHRLIDRNAYLQKGPEGYKKTASTMIKQGMQSPLYFGNL